MSGHREDRLCGAGALSLLEEETGLTSARAVVGAGAVASQMSASR